MLLTDHRSELSENVWARLDIISTIVMDGAMILVALAMRFVLLWFMDTLPGLTHSWAIVGLEFITDFALVGTALVYTTADLTKRVVRGLREARESFSLAEQPIAALQPEARVAVSSAFALNPADGQQGD